MISEANLIGWWVFVRANRHCEDLGAPTEVSQGFLDKGWMRRTEPEEECTAPCVMTDKGKLVADLNATAWGICPFGIEEDE